MLRNSKINYFSLFFLLFHLSFVLPKSESSSSSLWRSMSSRLSLSARSSSNRRYLVFLRITAVRDQNRRRPPLQSPSTPILFGSPHRSLYFLSRQSDVVISADMVTVAGRWFRFRHLCLLVVSRAVLLLMTSSPLLLPRFSPLSSSLRLPAQPSMPSLLSLLLNQSYSNSYLSLINFWNLNYPPLLNNSLSFPFKFQPRCCISILIKLKKLLPPFHFRSPYLPFFGVPL